MKKLLSVVLVLTMLMTLFVPFASAQELDNNIPSTSLKKEVYANGKVWFDLNGNAKFYATANDKQWKERATFSDFLPGVDYAGYINTPTGDFATDQNALSLTGTGGAFLRYTLDSGASLGTYSDPDFKTGEDGNIYWTIKGVDYLLRVNEKVIKNYHTTITTSSLTDESMIERYKSINNPHVIDVPDKKYTSIGLLAGSMLNYTKKLKVSLYYEGEAEPVVYDNDDMKLFIKAATSPADGTLYLRNFKNKDNSQAGGPTYFMPKEIQTESNKILTKIEIDDAGTNNASYAFFVISAWGIETTIEEKIATLSSLNEAGISDVADYEAVEKTVTEIDEYIANYKTALTEEQKVVYDTAKANLSAYENVLAQEKLYAQHKEWFDLNGNSKLFMDKNSADYTNRANLIDYLPGVDYGGYLATPTGVFATDKGAVANHALAIFAYTVDKSTATNSLPTKYADPADFKTGEDGKLYFVYKDVPYRVDPTKNVIKSLSKDITTTKLTNPEDIARHQSLKTGVTMDIPDGYYKNIGFLTAARNAYTKTFRLELYYEGEETPVTSDHKQGPPKEGSTYLYDIYFHTLTSTGGSGTGYFFTPWNIEVDSSKKLEKIRVYDSGLNNPTWPIHFISSWGDELTLAERFTALNTLNEAGITDKESYTAVADAVEEIEAVIAKTATTVANLKAEDKAIYDTAKANLTAYEVTFKNANDNLVVKSELEFKGNSKMFMDSTSEDYTNRLNLTNYYPGLDYAGLVKKPTGVFATDLGNANDGFGDFHACFAYTIGKGTKPAAGTSIPDFKKAENGKIYWTVNDIDYMVRPEEKTIKLSEGVSLTGIKDEAIKAKYKTLLEYTFDVPKGKYNSLTFLAGIMGTETYHRDANVTLIYEDGTTEDGTFNVRSTAVQSLTWAKGGVSFPRMISSTAAVWTKDYHTFAPYTVEADETKVLKAVKLTAVERSTSNAYKYPIYIVSISGSHTIKEVLSGASADMPKADAKVILDAVNKTLAENDITADDLTDETKAKYNLAKIAASALEVKSATFADSKVTVSYETEVDKAVKVIVAEYDDEDETLFNKATILPVVFNAESKAYEAPFTATGNKVKVFVWKDMINFFPYK